MRRKPFFNTTPRFGGRGGARGRVWYPLKLLHISYNLFAGTYMLSLSVYESIAIQILLWGDRPPMWPRGRARGLGVVPRETPPYYSYNLFSGTDMLSLSVYEPIAIQI